MERISSFRKIVLIVSGSLSVCLGVAGIFLPVLPTTPFLLLASACYIRSSDRLYNWLITNKYLGKYINNYNLKKGIPLKSKIKILILGLGAIIISSFMIDDFALKILLYVLGIIMFFVIYLIRTAKD